MTESCKDYTSIASMNRLVNKYPNLRNIYYGWGKDVNTDRPDKLPDNPMGVLTDVWKTINRMNNGTYLVAADTQRILDIYHKRWLNNNHWKVLESGNIEGTPYHVLEKK